MATKYYMYGEKEINYLKSKDKKLAAVIDKIGPLYYEVQEDIFSAVIYSIIGQQISTKAHQTIWKGFKESVKEINADSILTMGIEEIQRYGTTFRKADYITEFAKKVKSGELDLEQLHEMSEEEVITELSTLRGIGIWTAEMVLLFGLERPNVFSYGDLGIIKGLRMVHHHREITKDRFERYRKRYSPYGSTASLYLWQVAGGAIEGMKDYKIKK